jgi:hypothetical protein
MPAIIPQVLFDLESEMMAIVEDEFHRVNASENSWWREVTRVRTTKKKRDIVTWLLSTAQIYDSGKTGGDIIFDDMAATLTEYDVRNAAAGLKLSRNQLEDNDGNGYDFATAWSSQIGALIAYRPQELVSKLIIAGTTASSKAYDGVQFFADNVVNGGNGHPVNQFRPSSGRYFNWFHGAAVTTPGPTFYPGALPIDESVTVDVALKNLQIAMAYISSIKMPNGVTPRFLRARKLMVAPRLVARAQQLTGAKFIAQAAGASGGGSGDIEAIVSNWGLTKPIEVQEFANATLPDGASSDTTWYLVTDTVMETTLGSLVYVEREPYTITYYTGQGGGTGQDAILDRSRELEWHCSGRSVAGYGHGYALHRFDAT